VNESFDWDSHGTEVEKPTRARTMDEFKASQIAGAKKTLHTAMAHLLEILAANGGQMAESVLINKHGVRLTTIQAACDPTLKLGGEDKRYKTRCTMDVIDGVWVVWLTSTGRQATGQAAGREIRPTKMTMKHANGPEVLDAWLEQVRGQTESVVSIEINTFKSAAAEFSEDCTTLGWAAIMDPLRVYNRVAGGLINKGMLPDALILEKWEPGNLKLWQQCWNRIGDEMPDQDLAEMRYGVEIQFATNTAGLSLKMKVRKWDAAIKLGVAAGCVWVCTQAVADQLYSLGVGTDYCPGQVMISVKKLGIDPSATPFEPRGYRWWVEKLFDSGETL